MLLLTATAVEVTIELMSLSSILDENSIYFVRILFEKIHCYEKKKKEEDVQACTVDVDVTLVSLSPVI